MNKLISEKDLSSLTSLSISKLRQDRMKKEGIPFLKFKSAVRYPMKYVEAYIDKNLQVKV